MTANSITFEIIHQLHRIKGNPIFQNFPDHQSLDNIIVNVFNNYYQHWPQQVIIERSPTALTPANASYFRYQNHKFIFLKRDMKDILKSFYNLYRSNGDQTPTLKMFDELLEEDFMIMKGLLSITNGRKILDKKQYIEIDYEDIIADPKKVIENIYSFLEIEKFPHYFNNINQFEVNDKLYIDNALSYCKDMHTIRTDKIIKEEKPLDLPNIIIEKANKLNEMLNNG